MIKHQNSLRFRRKKLTLFLLIVFDLVEEMDMEGYEKMYNFIEIVFIEWT